jgi:hypothetical protein
MAAVTKTVRSSAAGATGADGEGTGQYFVDEHDLGFEVCGDREGKPHMHAA